LSHQELALAVFNGNATEKQSRALMALVHSRTGDFASVSPIIFAKVDQIPVRHHLAFWGLLAQFPPKPEHWDRYLDGIELAFASSDADTRKKAAIQSYLITRSSSYSKVLANNRLWSLIVDQVESKDKVLKKIVVENAITSIYAAENFEDLLPKLLSLIGTKFEATVTESITAAAIAGHDLSIAIPQFERMGSNGIRPRLVHALQRRDIGTAITLFEEHEELSELLAHSATQYIEKQRDRDIVKDMLIFVQRLLNSERPKMIEGACRTCRELALNDVDISLVADTLLDTLENTSRLSLGNVSINACRALIPSLSVKASATYVYSRVLQLYQGKGKKRNAAA